MSVYDTAIDALQTIAPVAIGLTALLISYICAQLARPLGGFIYTVFSAPLIVPKLGHIYYTIFINTFHLSFLFKLTGWIVSSIGILLPLIFFQYFLHEYATHPYLLWGVLIASILVTLNIMHGVHLMEIPDFPDHARLASNVLKVDMQAVDPRVLMRLSRAHFIDLTIINLFMIVVCYGVTAYCGNALRLFGGATQPASSLTNNVSSAFTFLQYITGDPLQLDGIFGQLIRIFYGASMFVYMVFFITLAPTLIEVREPGETRRSFISPETINEILKKTASSSTRAHSDCVDR